LDLREKIVELLKRGVPKAEIAHRFGVDRATVKRYCKQIDERGTLESRKVPSNKPKLEEQARRLLVEDLRQRPWLPTFRGPTRWPPTPLWLLSTPTPPVGEREDYERLCETSQAMIYAVMSR
jgi:DNA-binding transcriptional MocR family regulator